MKITDQDIIRTACQLRDEENQSLRVSPWNRRRSHFHVPSWLVTIPAAAIIGFVLGLWTQDNKQDGESLTAHVDTVYIKVHESQPSQDSALQAIPASQPSVAPRHVARRAARPSAPAPRPNIAVGRPVSDDHIRYDLLVRN